MLKGGPKIVTFQDFAIRFEAKQQEGYPIRVSAGAANGAGLFRIPFSSGELETLLAELGSAIRRSAATAGVRDPERHLVPVADDTAPAMQLRTSGAKLFRALFSGQVGNLYNFCRGGAERIPDRGLRIMLRFDSKHPDLPRLSNLPWELLYDEDRRAFLNLSRFTPIIRCLEVPHPGLPLIFQPPLRILVVISRPVSHGALNLAEERRLIEGAWEKHRAVEVTFLESATVTALREALLKQPYQVIHFMGHGAFEGHQEEGTLLFENSDGTAHTVSGSSLASLLGDVRSLRLIVLNACDTARVSNQQGHDPLTGVATALVAGGLFAVVAMQFPISDEAAIAFTRSFYPRLAAGDPVDAAAAEGRLAIHTENQDSLEWSTPVLFMRSPEGIPFEELVPELVKTGPGPSADGHDDERLLGPPAALLRSFRWPQMSALLMSSFLVLFLVSVFSITPNVDLTEPGALATEALLSGQTFLFTVSFALTVLATLLTALSLLSVIQESRRWRDAPPKAKLKRFAWPLVSLLLAAIFAPIAWSTRESIHGTNQEAAQIGSQFINSFSGFRLLIIGKQLQVWGEEPLAADGEYRYQIVRTREDGTRELYRQIVPSGNMATAIDGIDKGQYEVRMLFYGLVVDKSPAFAVDKKICHVVNLQPAGLATAVYFSVKDSEGRPVEGAWIRVVGQQGQPIRGGRDHSITDRDGLTEKALWLLPLFPMRGNKYIAEIIEVDEVIAEQEFSIERSASIFEKTTVSLVLNE